MNYWKEYFIRYLTINGLMSTPCCFSPHVAKLSLQRNEEKYKIHGYKPKDSGGIACADHSPQVISSSSCRPHPFPCAIVGQDDSAPYVRTESLPRYAFRHPPLMLFQCPSTNRPCKLLSVGRNTFRLTVRQQQQTRGRLFHPPANAKHDPVHRRKTDLLHELLTEHSGGLSVSTVFTHADSLTNSYLLKACRIYVRKPKNKTVRMPWILHYSSVHNQPESHSEKETKQTAPTRIKQSC